MGWRRAIAGQQLVVVVARQLEPGDGSVAGNGSLDQVVDVAPPGRDRDGGLVAQGRFEVHARVEEIHVDVAARLLGLELLHAHVHDAARGVAVVGREVAWVELQVVDHADRQHAAQAAEVVHQRHLRAVEEELGVRRRGAAHDDLAREGLGSRHAGEVLEHSQGIAGGAWHLLDDGAFDDHAADFLALPLGLDDDIEGIVRALFDVVLGLGALAGEDLLGGAEGIVVRSLDANLPLARRQIEEMKGAAGVGNVLEADRRVALGAKHGDQDAGHGRARAALDQPTGEVLDGQRRGLGLDRGVGWRGWLGRRWLGGGEGEGVVDLHLGGLARQLGRLEHEIVGGGQGGLLETETGGRLGL